MRRAGQVALVGHAVLDPLHLFLVDIDEEIARLLEVDLRGEEGGGIHPVVVLRRHVAERGGGQRAADAIADDIDLLGAGGVLRGLDRPRGIPRACSPRSSCAPAPRRH